MLEAHGVSYRYRNTPWLFRNVDLKIKPGEVVGLYGLSGSGKSTLGKILSGYISPLEGKVTVNDQVYPMKGRHPVQLVWQHPEQAINPRWRMRKVFEDSGGISNDLLTAFGIQEEWFNRFPSELSGGELQRFCLARAFHADTKFIIADEITTMLDAITQAQIWQTILQVVEKRNVGVLAISHDYHLLQKICHRVIHFHEL